MPKNNKLGCSYSTQLKLAKSLKELMAYQPFEKLSVSDITNNSRFTGRHFIIILRINMNFLIGLYIRNLWNRLLTDFHDSYIITQKYKIYKCIKEKGRIKNILPFLVIIHKKKLFFRFSRNDIGEVRINISFSYCTNFIIILFIFLTLCRLNWAHFAMKNREALLI